MNKCLTCGSKELDNRHIRYFVVPGFIIVPNSYLLCDNHKELKYYYDDLYDEKGNRKKIDHETVMNRDIEEKLK